MPKRIKIPLPPDPLGLFHPITGGKEEFEIPAPPFPFPLPGEEVEEEEEEERLGWRGESEEKKVLNLLKAADRELKRGNIEGAYAHLDYAIGLSSCDRCIRGMRTIVQKIRDRHLSEARRRLSEFMRLIPLYYEVLRREGNNLNTELDATKNIEEECESCEASAIIEECRWSSTCLDHIIKYIDKKKEEGSKIMKKELIDEARNYFEREREE